MPFTQTQTLKYERREDDIAVLAKIIDVLGHKDIPRAIELLMEYRNNLIESQMPTVALYDPRVDRVR